MEILSVPEKLRVLLVNGNTSQSVTDRLADLSGRIAPQFTFDRLTPHFGPSYVSTPADVAVAAHAVVETIARAVEEAGAVPAACMIACFGEPGLAAARHRFGFPVIGMAEASMLTAIQGGGDFAILTLGDHWPAMLRDLVRLYGVAERCVGIECVAGAPFDLLSDPDGATAAVARAAANLARRTGAATVIVGGAALAGLAPRAEPQAGVRLLDCLVASVAQLTALIECRQMEFRLSGLS